MLNPLKLDDRGVIQLNLITEDLVMRKALASVVVIIFAGLLCTSLLTIFTGSTVSNQYMNNHSLQYPYYMSY